MLASEGKPHEAVRAASMAEPGAKGMKWLLVGLNVIVLAAIVFWLGVLTVRIEQVRQLAAHACTMAYLPYDQKAVEAGKPEPKRPLDCFYNDFVSLKPPPAKSK
jgi:hypothetical protein